MREYEPEKIFTKDGDLVDELKALAPTGKYRMSANPVTNGGALHEALKMPDFKKYGHEVKKSGTEMAPSMNIFADYLTDIMRKNPKSFRVFGPDETESNKLSAIYDASKKVWLGEYFEYDNDGGNLAPQGRVIEMLSEHACEGELYSCIYVRQSC